MGSGNGFVKYSRIGLNGPKQQLILDNLKNQVNTAKVL